MLSRLSAAACRLLCMSSLPLLQASLGRAIRRLRQQTGYSQERFGFRIGVHRTCMGNLERGAGNPTIATLDRVAHGLGVSVVELFQLALNDAPNAGSAREDAGEQGRGHVERP
jgi:transcriptional regulator with XRE-family HTH domain